MVDSKLRSIRERASWTQEQLATNCGLDVRTIRRIELGKTAPSPESRARIAEALNVAVETVFPCVPDGNDGMPLCETYAAALLEALRARTEPFVPPQDSKGNDVLTALLQLTTDGGRACIVGPPGCGKSFVLLRAARALIARGDIPIFARCRLMTGDPHSWLDRVVSLYGTASFEALVGAARQQGRRVVLIIDGVNECPTKLIDVMVEVVQGIARRESAALLASAQVMEDPWGSALGTVAIHLGPPSSEEKKALARALGANFDDVGPEVLGLLQTAMDVTLAAKAWNRNGDSTTRFSLLHEFNRQRLARAEEPELCHRAGRILANTLTRRVLRAMPEAEASRIAERHAYPQALSSLTRLGVCQLEQEQISFSHDLHLDYFATQHLLFEHASPATLAVALEAPVYAPLTDLALQAQSDPQSVIELIRRSTSVDGSLAKVLTGQLGRVHQDAALQELRARVRRVISEIGGLTLDTDVIKANLASTDTPWFTALGAACDEAAPRSVALELLSAADSWVMRHADGRRAFNKAYDALCHFSANTPISTVLLSAHNASHGLWPVRGVPLPKEVLTFTKAPCTAMLWCFLAKRWLRSHWQNGTFSEDMQDEAVRFIDVVINSHSRSLMLEGLQMADDLANAFSAERQASILRILENVDARDPFVSTFLLDALDAYGVLEPAYDEQALVRRISELLASPENAMAQQEAFGMYAAQLEPISPVHGPHIAAIATLTEDDRATFYSMALHGAEQAEACSGVAMCLRDLSKIAQARNHPLAHAAVAAWACRRPAMRTMPQDDVYNFLEAHRCAVALGIQIAQEPASDEPAELVWLGLGQLAREAFSGTRPATAQNTWDQLGAQLLRASVAPMTWVVNVERMWRIPALLGHWPEELLRFFRQAIDAPGIAEWADLAPSRGTLCGAVIDALGELGDDTDRHRLQRFLDHPTVGRDAVAATKRLAERKASPLTTRSPSNSE